MKVIESIEEIRKEINSLKMSGKKIGFVPTMGSLHSGHLSLVKLARQYCDYVVMSIFVNEIQFNDKNDFKGYPRELKNDLNKAETAGVNLVFTPNDSTMYKNNLTFINVEKITDTLCGKYRAGHFQGVFTVVAKLFNITNPDIAIFGQKDIQQAVSIEKMTMDLNFDVKIIIAPIVREADGLAMSSRNIHLSNKEREDALILSKLLNKAESLILNREKNTHNIIENLKNYALTKTPDIKFEYISLVDYNTLQNIEILKDKSILALAAYVGQTRLIDNMIIKMDRSLRCIY